MSKILIFGGTTEGRELATVCDKLKLPTILCVATEYGREVLPQFHYVKVSEKRLNTDEIVSLIEENQINCVIDATHPYAYEISKNILAAIKSLSKEVKFFRIKRESMDVNKGHELEFNSNNEAIEYLLKTKGNILLTTGSKEISQFAKLSDRIFARVLPSVDSINACISAGVVSKNIIAMQGPFSRNLNEAIIKELNCKYLVTKVSGKSGGFDEKIKSCENTGCIPVIILPQSEVVGISLEECIQNIKIFNKEKV